MPISANNLLVKQLVEFGLSEKEAKVYLALLELEVAAVSEVAKTANINRSSAYVVLESLKKKGLVSTSEDKKIQRYAAVSPEMLLREAEEMAQKSDSIKNKINDIIPELKALHKSTKQKLKVRIFEGKQGLINAHEDSLNNKEKIIRVFSSAKNLFKFFPTDYFPDFIKKRVELGIKMYGIHPDDETARENIKIIPKSDERVFIPKEKYQFPAEMAIYDDKIRYMFLEKGGFLISIESKEIVGMMKNVFDLAFEEAKRLNKYNKKNRKK